NQADSLVRSAVTDRRRSGGGSDRPLIERLNQPKRLGSPGAIAVYPRLFGHAVVTGDAIAITASGRSAEAWNLANYEFATRTSDRVMLGETLFRLRDHRDDITQLALVDG